MKRTVLFVIGLIIAGTLAYFSGYYAYKAGHPETELLDAESVQKAIQTSEKQENVSGEYYVGKIEQNLLVIYKMPEEILYDSVELSSLGLYENEKAQLLEGMVFGDLKEVFEFLENSMS